jgi:hypothetical protein
LGCLEATATATANSNGNGNDNDNRNSNRNDNDNGNGKRRSFDFVVRKSANNFAQDDTVFGWASRIRTRLAGEGDTFPP